MGNFGPIHTVYWCKDTINVNKIFILTSSFAGSFASPIMLEVLAFTFWELICFRAFFCRLFAQQTKNNAKRRSAPNNSPHYLFSYLPFRHSGNENIFRRENVMFTQQKNGDHHCPIPLLTFVIFMTPFFSHFALPLKGQCHEFFGLIYFS